MSASSLLESARVPENIEQAKQMLHNRFGTEADLRDENGHFHDFMDAFAWPSFYTFLALLHDARHVPKAFQVRLKTALLPFLQLIIPLMILRNTLRDNLDENSYVGDVGYCPDNADWSFRLSGCAFMLYSVWDMADTSQDSCSNKLMIRAAIFYQVTGQRPSPLWAMGFFVKLACGLALTITLYFMMVEAATITDLTSYMYGISFLISIDSEW
eukprot:CAMPEP_0171092086 /NCGR_PEP_ID=MMETSP0766_2-20121228/35487_1 /TAXON_ID=439317 /ORGANISM="Gambierdiscus australes, Strain CAWD 149" /LENGTH=212 /DNA_ID=CAMNT_0011550285 /DNA_START=62 /DNA_END=697 /DNA_ORIENTATION=+